MFSVRLTELPRTTSFRLAMLFAGLFGLAALALFGFLYWRTAGYISTNVDAWLARETAARALSSASELETLLDARARIDPDGRTLIALFNPDGSRLAGNRARLPASLTAMDRPFGFTLARGGEVMPFRGMMHRLPSGQVLLVARDMRDIRQFRDRLLGAMASGGGLVLLLGLAGAAIIGAGTLSRIDRITCAIERIVDGNLGARLPGAGPRGDLARLSGVVNRMLDEIERLMREVKGVTEDVAHDLRTPLTRLLAGLERVRRRAASTEEYATAVDEAIVETKGLLAAFRALLRIAEAESGARRAGFTRVALDSVAADVAELYEPVAEGNGITLSLSTEGSGRARIAGDPNLLFEAISNLVDNAIKYSPSGSRVDLRVLAGERPGIEVSDTGPGIPDAEREAVLRRFYRVDKRRATPGSGLGLSLVAAVARLHDLQLEIADADPGCRVTLRRPTPTTASDPNRPAACLLGNGPTSGPPVVTDEAV
jgi:signal transduction histidine kinase